MEWKRFSRGNRIARQRERCNKKRVGKEAFSAKFTARIFEIGFAGLRWFSAWFFEKIWWAIVVRWLCIGCRMSCMCADNVEWMYKSY